MTVESEFLGYSITKLRQESAYIEACLKRLTTEQVWMRGGESQNAIGNLLLHLTGNVRQWILAGVGGVEIQRDRDGEFAARGGMGPGELTADLQVAVEGAVRIIQALPAGRLVERVNIQGHEVSVLEAIYHVVEHFSGHTGQVILLTKSFTDSDMGFYGYLNSPGGAAGRKP
ncbi:MAG: DUF1572 family protein [Bryobacteraceae bacterium]